MIDQPADSLSEPTGEHPSELALIRLRQRELEPAAQLTLQAHLAGCLGCRERLEAMAVEAERFLERHPMPRSWCAVDRRWWRRWRRWLELPRLPVAVVGVASVLVILGVATLLARRVGAPLEDGAAVRLKGDPIQWIVKRGSTQLVAGPDFELRAGDAIGLVVTATRPSQLRVFSVDEKGTLEELMPAPGEPPVAVQPGRRAVSPFSLYLEPPLSARRLFALLTAHPVDSVALRRAVDQGMRRLRSEHKDIAQLTTLDCPGEVQSRFIPQLDSHPTEENR